METPRFRQCPQPLHNVEANPLSFPPLAASINTSTSDTTTLLPRSFLPTPISLPDSKSLNLPLPSRAISSPTPSALSSSYSRRHSITSPQASYSINTPSLFASLAPTLPTALSDPQVPSQLPEPLPSTMKQSDSATGESDRSTSPMRIDELDLDDIQAAETLAGLRNADINRTPYPSSSNTQSERRGDEKSSAPSPQIPDQTPEPLLSLITSSHPWLGGTLRSSLSAYQSTMSSSPQFVQSFVRNRLATVGSLSRSTGVEHRVRQYFSDSPDRRNATSTKGPSVTSEATENTDYEASRADSQISRTETLPAYDDNRAPDYDQTFSLSQQQSSAQSNSEAPQSSRLFMTTSSLGVSLSDRSLNSLKYVLGVLKVSTNQLSATMAAISKLMAEYERYLYRSHEIQQQQQQQQQAEPEQEPGRDPAPPQPQGQYPSPEQDAQSQAIAANIKRLGNEVIDTLQSVTNQVSAYTGGYLPENAAALVRRQLLSIPQRWKVAEERTPAQSSPTRHAQTIQFGQKFLLFAEQGCDMIAQVTIVLAGTVESAETWLESMSRRNTAGERQQEPNTTTIYPRST